MMCVVLCVSQTWTHAGSWEFLLSGLVLTVGSNDGAGSSSSSSKCYSLICKPAASDGLDDGQPFYIGVPGWLALSESNTWGKNYFLARLEPEQQQQQQQQQGQPFVGDSVEQLTQWSAGKLAKGGSNVAVAAAATGTSSGSYASNHGMITLPAAAAAGAAPGSVDYMWLPRGYAVSGGSSGSSAALSSSKSLGSFGMSAAGGSSNHGKVDCGSSSGRLSVVTAATSTIGSSDRGSSELLPKLALSVVSVDTNSIGSNGCSSGRSGAVSSAVGSLVRGLPIPGLVMGPLLGRGSYGRVYRGLLKGRPVAVKVGRSGLWVFPFCCMLWTWGWWCCGSGTVDVMTWGRGLVVQNCEKCTVPLLTTRVLGSMLRVLMQNAATCW
jgi:hypothetical protein